MPTGREDSLAWQLGLAGAACTVAQGTIHWVETTMVRQQLATNQQNMLRTVQHIVRTEGAPALYRGFAAAGMRELSYSSLRFGLYEPIKKSLGAEDPATTPFYKKVLAGLLAGAFASAVASPTDLLKIRAQAATGPSESVVAHARAIAKGPAKPWPLNFYRGVSATIVRASCLGATKMATYDQTKTYLRSTCGWRDAVPLERYKLQGAAAVATGLAITVATSHLHHGEPAGDVQPRGQRPRGHRPKARSHWIVPGLRGPVGALRALCIGPVLLLGAAAGRGRHEAVVIYYW